MEYKKLRPAIGDEVIYPLQESRSSVLSGVCRDTPFPGLSICNGPTNRPPLDIRFNQTKPGKLRLRCGEGEILMIRVALLGCVFHR